MHRKKEKPDVYDNMRTNAELQYTQQYEMIHQFNDPVFKLLKLFLYKASYSFFENNLFIA